MTEPPICVIGIGAQKAGTTTVARELKRLKKNNPALKTGSRRAEAPVPPEGFQDIRNMCPATKPMYFMRDPLDRLHPAYETDARRWAQTIPE